MCRFFLFFVLAASLLWSCDSRRDEAGVVARVNSRPLYFKQLEAKYDLSHLGWTGGVTPTLGKLKKEYRKILSELIAQELIFQVLEEKGISVTTDELNRAEAEVRTDYPQGVFEKVLVEEFIDLDVWREQLRAHLAYEKFLNKLLRPSIQIEQSEAEAYYKQHADKFTIPPRVSFLLLTGANRDDVAHATELCQRERSCQRVMEQITGVALQEIKSRDDRLPRKWAEALKELSVGEASPIFEVQPGFEAVVLRERTPLQKLDPEQAYPLVENILIEQKLHKAFTAWLENEIKGADIYISTHLLQTSSPKDEVEPAQGEPASMPSS